jgi:hypothetical protein
VLLMSPSASDGRADDKTWPISHSDFSCTE